MASGLPDYQRGIDIASQSLSTLTADIVAQTLENLNVDIVAQTLSNLSVDLAVQSLSELSIDIIAQSLSNLNIDVNAQSLGEVTNRPKYGGAVTTIGGVAVTANDRTTLATVSGKGMLYGGVIFLWASGSQKTAYPLLQVDGELIAHMKFETLMRLGINKPFAYPLFLLMYDDVEYEYCVAVMQNITFETSFDLIYDEREGATPTVYFHVCYALI